MILNFNEWLIENYGITAKDSAELSSIYDKSIIRREWEAYIASISR